MGCNVKFNVVGDFYLSTTLWGKQQARYTGIHAFHIFGSVKPLTGINLSDPEWDTLVENFSKVKDLLNGKQVNLSLCKRSFDSEETIKMYAGKWMLGGKAINPNPKEFFSEQEALFHARERVPIPGRDYKQSEGTPEIRVECITKSPPKPTDLMSIVFAYHFNEKIQAVVKENCEACRINSDSQFDHCRPGNCLDETFDFVQQYGDAAREKIKSYDLMNVFDAVRSKIGAKPILSKQLAKAAVAWISVTSFMDQVRKNQEDSSISSLMDIVRRVHDNVVSQ